MRIWHYKIIPALPTTQLVAQWRELNSIYEKQDKHILINYIYEYDKIALYNYSLKVIREFKRRGFKIKSFEKFYEYFKDIIPKHQEPLMILFKNEKEYFNTLSYEEFDMLIRDDESLGVFGKHHDRQYLEECFFNLREKYRRGQSDFSRIQFIYLMSILDNEILYCLNRIKRTYKEYSNTPEFEQFVNSADRYEFITLKQKFGGKRYESVYYDLQRNEILRSNITDIIEVLDKLDEMEGLIPELTFKQKIKMKFDNFISKFKKREEK